MTKLVITTGEPAGIGPEVSVKAAWKSTAPIILVGDREMLLRQAVQLDCPPSRLRTFRLNMFLSGQRCMRGSRRAQQPLCT